MRAKELEAIQIIEDYLAKYPDSQYFDLVVDEKNWGENWGRRKNIKTLIAEICSDFESYSFKKFFIRVAPKPTSEYDADSEYDGLKDNKNPRSYYFSFYDQDAVEPIKNSKYITDLFKEYEMSEVNKSAVAVIEKTLARPEFQNITDNTPIKIFRDNVHTWNSSVKNIRVWLSDAADGRLLSIDNIIHFSIPNSFDISPGFKVTPGQKLDFDAYNAMKKGHEMKNELAGYQVGSSIKTRAMDTVKDSLSDIREGAQIRTIQKIGGNLVGAMTALVPNEEAKEILSNELVKTGIQGLLAFIMQGMCDEGAIPEKIRPYVKKACKSQLEALGYEFTGPVLDQAFPLAQILLAEMAAAGKSMMTSEEIEKIEAEMPKVRVDAVEEIEISLEEEKEEKPESRMTA